MSKSSQKIYIPKTPVKWGLIFFFFFLSSALGIVYEVFLHSDAVNSQINSELHVVLSIIDTLPKHQNYKIFFDNWFYSMLLCLSLKDKGYLATAAPIGVCTKFCTLLAEKDLKKQGRGSHCFRTDANSAISGT